MKNLILILCMLLTVFVYSQDNFEISKNGLTPKFLISKIDSLTKIDSYKKTLFWVSKYKQKYKLIVDKKLENEEINLMSIKGNAVNLNKQYFNVKYKIKVSFEKGNYKFEPTAIQLKINSKYDMGWKDFNLTDGTQYFKKEKVLRKYKSYLKDITALLNELNFLLSNYLKTE
jgi:hypothetical protein